MTIHTVVMPSVVAVGVLLALSAFFSSSESAIFSLPDEWQPALDGDTAEHRALGALRANPHRLLVTLLVGNNLVNIALTSIVTLLVARFVPPGSTVVVATLGVSVLVLVFGEIVPKAYGLGHAESWSLRVARHVATVQRVLGPVVAIFETVTRWLGARIGADQHIERPYVDD